MSKRFGFLLFNDFEDLDFMGPWEIIALWSQRCRGPEELIVVNQTGDHVTSAKGLTLLSDSDFEHCPPLDFLLVPGGQGTREEVNNVKLTQFIAKQAQSCQHVLSVCTGAFLLQAAGLLAGKKATTHWHSFKRLQAFEDIEVVNQRYVRDDNIWSAAGISAGIDLALAFIAEIAGEKVAGDIQAYSEYYPQGVIYPNSDNIFPGYV